MAKSKTAQKKNPKGKSKAGRPPKGSGPSKSEFIRERLALGMSLAEIVQAGAEQNLEIAPNLIHKLKSRTGATKRKQSAATASKPRGKGKQGYRSGAEFVREHPDKNALELVKLGKQFGVKVTTGLVYQTRAYDRRRAGAGATAPGARRSLKSSAAAYSKAALPLFGRGGSSSEGELKRALLAVGFPRALEVVQELQRKLEVIERQYVALVQS